MVGIKDAVANATKFARDSLGPERTADIRLEEIESGKSDGQDVWLITLSSVLAEDRLWARLRPPGAPLGADIDREYKVFTVAKDTGQVLSMKIRLLATP
jgi:hypothetical protein